MITDIQFILALIPNPEIYDDLLELIRDAVEIDEQRATEFLDSVNHDNHSDIN
jgi:hypothetical protein